MRPRYPKFRIRIGEQVFHSRDEAEARIATIAGTRPGGSIFGPIASWSRRSLSGEIVAGVMNRRPGGGTTGRAGAIEVVRK